MRGGVKRIIEYATRLAHRGHDVDVLCEDLEQPAWLPKDIYNGFKLKSFRDYQFCETDVAIATGGRSARRLGRMQRAKVKVYSVVMQESLNKPTVKHGQEIDRDRFLEDPYKQNWIYVANSSWLQKLVETEYNQKCHLILNGINEQILKPIDGLRDPDKFICLAYGRSEGWKGGARSARAAELARAEIKNLELLSYGQSKGPVTNIPLRHHRCPDQHMLAQIYASAHVFLQSSRFEGFCNTAFEAMACGTPVITTDIRGIEDFCIPNETALFVPPDDERAMANEIIKLSKDPYLWQTLRKNGLRKVQEFSWNAQMEKLEDIFVQALHAKSA